MDRLFGGGEAAATEELVVSKNRAEHEENIGV